MTLDGQSSTRLFLVGGSGISFEIVDLALANGKTSSGDGGAIDDENSSGHLTIIGSTFSKNEAYTRGGAIRASGNITLTVTATTFSDNHPASDGQGGAVSIRDGTATITNSTFYNNNSWPNGQGGAIRTFSETLTIANSTLTHNSAGSGGELFIQGGTVSLHATILTGNVSQAAGQNCAGSITSQDYNLIGADSACTITGTTTHDQDNVSATFQTSSLQNNGGPTPTLLLATTSNGYDAIPLASCGTAIDQRDYPRGDGGDGTCDSSSATILIKAGEG